MRKLAPIICMALIVFSCNNGKNTKQTVNSISKSDKTIMTIFAHADDDMTILPILSKYVKEGVNIHSVIVTDGSKGVKKHVNIPLDSLAIVRSNEAYCVTTILGINSPIFLNYTEVN